MKTKKLEKKTVVAVVAIVALVVVCAIMIIVPRFTESENDLYAYIDFNGEIVREINLTKASDEEFEIRALADHVVKFQIEDHKIRFLESECPDKICVHTGWLSRENDIAACLPNRVTLFVTSKQ